MNTIFTRLQTFRLAAVLLVVLAWSNLAFCGEIHDAAQKGDLAKVKALLKDNPDLINSKTDKSSYLVGGTPLDYAAMGGHKDMVEFLLANKADPNPKDYATSTPLLQAAEFGHKDIVELLLAKKAGVNAKSISGWTALHCAAYCDHREVAVLLLAHGADVNSTNSDGLTPLDKAVEGNNTDLIELLIANHAEVNVQDAAGAGDLKKVKALLKDNPDLVFSKIHCGWTALYFAARNGQKEVAEFLLANKADLNVKDCIGQTPLHMAVQSGYKDMVELLIASGADVNAKDNSGRTPLHMANHHNMMLISRVIPKGSLNVGADVVAASDKLYQAVADVLLRHGGTE